MGFLLTLLSVFRIAVIPAQFQDTGFTYSPGDFRPVLDRAEQYLNDQFRGGMTFEFTLASPVTLRHGISWYGANPSGAHDQGIYEAVTEAVKASGSEIDFSQFDNDGDGTVDCIALLTAGLSESDGAGEDAIWPQQGWLHEKQAEFSIGGKTADAFIAFTELKSDLGRNPRLAGIGDLCHELLHILGLPDFYDVNGETSGLSKGLWATTALMDSGNRNDDGRTPPNLGAIELECLGLGQCDTLGTGEYTLSPIDRDGRYLKIVGDIKDEYILLECREAKGWDAFIGGSGLLAYHVDRSEPDYSAFWAGNTVNADASHPGAFILEAAPEADNVSKVFFPQPGHTALTSQTHPAMGFKDGSMSPLAITGITKEPDGCVSFKVTEPVRIKEITVFQDAAIISWELDTATKDGWRKVSWYRDGIRIGSAEVAGCDSFTIEHLDPQTEYKVSVSITTAEGAPCAAYAPFKTKTFRKEIHPYIYLRDSDRHPDGSFNRGARIPLRIFNVIDAEATEWTFEGHPIATGPDGYFTITESGRLKAKIYHGDGTVDLIIKDIVVQ